MNDWLLAQWNWLRKRVDYLVIGLLAILLGVTAFFWWLEQQILVAPRPNQTVVPMPTPSPVYKVFMEETFVHHKDPRKVPEFRGLMEFNMFDARATATQRETVDRLEKEFEKANDAFLKGDLATARKICQDIIKEMPSHRKAVDLQKTISELEKKQLEPKTPAKTP